MDVYGVPTPRVRAAGTRSERRRRPTALAFDRWSAGDRLRRRAAPAPATAGPFDLDHDAFAFANLVRAERPAGTTTSRTTAC
jgi:hypothetical protein